jgi:hypothetical protein
VSCYIDVIEKNHLILEQEVTNLQYIKRFKLKSECKGTRNEREKMNIVRKKIMKKDLNTK